MRRILTVTLTLLLAFSGATAAAQESMSSNDNTNASIKARKKRGPVFRASKEQISQAQTILKQRRLYVGDPTGKLDAETRAGLKRFQEAEGLKTTGTLNRATLEKMNIPLTERQRTM